MQNSRLLQFFDIKFESKLIEINGRFSQLLIKGYQNRAIKLRMILGWETTWRMSPG